MLPLLGPRLVDRRAWTSTTGRPGPPTTGWAWRSPRWSRSPATWPATSGRRGSGSTWSRPARCGRWPPSRSPGSPRSRTPGTGARRWAGTSTTRCRSRRRCARCSRTGCRSPPARWCGPTAGSTRSASDRRAGSERGVNRGARVPVRSDALLVLSFGGPEGPDEVRPFLENVTRGRGVPPERLDAVEEHYRHFGGVSPLNARNRELIAADPGAHRRCRSTSATATGTRWSRTPSPRWPATGCGARWCSPPAPTAATRRAGSTTRTSPGPARPSASGAPELVKLRHFFDHPLFVAANADAVRGRAALPAAAGRARLVFTAHSVPTAADAAGRAARRGRAPLLAAGRRGGPAGRGRARGGGVRRGVAVALRAAAGAVAGARTSSTTSTRCTPRACPAVVVAPVGFVSDHVEVVWDLDTEARERAAELGMGFARAATAGPDPRFADMVVELVAEHTGDAPPRRLSTIPSAGCTLNGAPCAVGLLRHPPARPRPERASLTTVSGIHRGRAAVVGVTSRRRRPGGTRRV